jgi:PAS domain S-box-containing protein
MSSDTSLFSSIFQNSSIHKQLFETHTAPMLIIDPETSVIIDANFAASRLYGWNQEQLRQMNFKEIIFYTPHQIKNDLYQTTQSNNTGIEFQHRFADGTIRYVEVFSNLFECNGKRYLHSIIHDISARKRTEEKLHESEEKFYKIFQASPSAISITHLDSQTILDCNPAFEHLFGYSKDEIIGKKAFALTLWKNSNDCSRLVQEHLTQQCFFSHELELRNKSGKVIVCNSYFSLINIHNQNYSISIISDSTERKKAVQIILESEERYRELFNACPDGIVLIDNQGYVKRANTALAEMYSYQSPEDMVDIHNSQLVAPSSRVRSEQIFTRRLKGEDIPLVQYELLRKDETVFFGEILAKQLHNPDNSIAGFICVTRDITKRKAFEESFRKSGIIFKLLTSYAADVIWTYDLKKNKFTYISDSVEKLRGYTTKEVLNQSMKEALTEASFKNLTNLVALKIEEGITKDSVVLFTNNVLDQPCKNGSVVTTEVSSSTMLLDQNGIPSEVIGISRDITKRIKAEETMRNTQRLESLGILAGGIAHDFNNILGAIVGYADMSLEEAVGNHRLTRNLNQILKSAERAKELIVQILSFSRQRPDTFNPMYVSPIITEALNMLRASLPSSIEIKSNLAKDTKPILANSTHIHEIIVNLCVNASHAMKEFGLLEINHSEVYMNSPFDGKLGTSKKGLYSLITVKDNGAGIPPDILPHIFEPYFTTKEIGKGTGLGLAVVLGIIQSHSGNIRVDSIINKGTQFTVYLPKIDKAPAPVEDTDKKMPEGSEHILFIDDEEVLCDIVRSTLIRLGYKVTVYSDSVQALLDFKKQPHLYDLVITDQTMPVMTGIELAKELIKIRNDIPVLLCTGYSNTVDEKIAIEAGIRSYCMKPVRKAEMAQMIRSIFDENKKGTLKNGTCADC